MTLAVVYFNESLNLPRLLESFEENFKNQKSPTNFLFLDNASEDGSFELIEKWMAGKSWLKGQNIKRTTNHMAQARQQALALCEDEWLAFIDADSQLEPNWIECAEKAISVSSHSIAAIGGHSSYQMKKTWHAFAESLSSHFPIGKKDVQRVPINHIPTNNYLLKVDKAQQAGGFDPFFDRVGEDLDLNIRLKKIGEIVYDPSFKVKHHLPEKLYSWYVKMAYYGRAQSYVALKYREGIPPEKFIPAGLVALFTLSLITLPLPSSLLFVLFCLIPKFRFLMLSFLFYGLGEWVGAFRMVLSGKIFMAASSGR